MDSKIEKVLDKLLVWLDGAEGLITEQAPAVIRQMLEYEAWSCGVWVWALGIALAICGVLFVIGCAVAINSSYNEEGAVVLIVMSLIFSLVFGICFVDNYTDLKKVEIAPKVIVMEKLKEMK